MEVRSWGQRLEVEDPQLGEWRRSSWSRAREPRAGQSVEDLLEVEVRPEPSTEGQAHYQEVPGLEGNLDPGDNCSVVWEALHYKPVLRGQY